MSVIPKITCRRCGREYSGLRSRCPYCGTSRSRSAERIPLRTSSENAGTPAAEHAAPVTTPTPTPTPTPSVTSITITFLGSKRTEFAAKVGDEVPLSTTIYPTGGDQTVTWSSKDESIATVSDKGVVTGVGKGTTTITAECGGVKADCTVYITAK